MEPLPLFFFLIPKIDHVILVIGDKDLIIGTSGQRELVKACAYLDELLTFQSEDLVGVVADP